MGKFLTKEEVIDRCNKANNYKYDYSEIEYNGRDNIITPICPKHGKFEMTPDKHLQGEGCKFCRQSKLEQKITVNLLKSKIIFERYSKFHWLKFQSLQNLDFYLPDYNIAIECQGEQHFRPVSIYDNEKGFKLTIERDINKFKLCQENGVKLLYLFPKEKVDFAKVNEQYEIYKPNGNIFYSPEELIEYIKSQPKIKNLEE